MSMMRHRLTRWMVFGGAIAWASGCVYPISKKIRLEAKSNLTIPMVQKDPAAFAGSTVIWGGIILNTANRPDGSDLAILEMPLDVFGMPQGAEYTRGRFIARSPDFLDPAIYRRGRKITLAGAVAGIVKRPLGKTEYAYPVVTIKELHLWPTDHPVYPPPYYGWVDQWEGANYWPYYDTDEGLFGSDRGFRDLEMGRGGVVKTGHGEEEK